MKTLSFLFCLIPFQFCFGQDSLEMEIILMNQKIYQGLFDDKPSPNYLYPIQISDSFFTACKGTPFESLANESMGWYFSYVGGYKQALSFYAIEIESKPLQTSDLENLSKYKSVDAREAVLGAAKNHDILLLNEAHHKPQHRIFTTSLLLSLKAQGYNTLAVETLGEQAHLLNETKKVDESLGGLAIEPNYADLIRQALKLGYTLLPYDYDSPFDFVGRDSLGATRILAHMKSDPQAKVIVHCGYEHIDEQQKALAYWLKLGSGKEVLTVNQTDFTEEFTPDLEEPYYQMAMSYHDSAKPFMLKRKEKFFRPRNSSDLFVFHPRTGYSHARPDWHISYEVPEPRFLVEFPVKYMKSIPKLSIVQAFYSTEYDSGIPVDQFLIHPSESLPKALILPSGTFTVTREDVDRKNMLSIELSVDAEGNYTFEER